MKSILLFTAILLLVFGIVIPSTLGFIWSDYSAAESYLSELGAMDAPYAYWMNYFGFLPLSILWALSLLILHRLSPKGGLLTFGILLLLGTSISYFGAVMFPCDAGCPIEGSERQLMHNSLGIIGYLTAPPGLMLLGAHYLRNGKKFIGGLTFFAAACVLIGFLALASSQTVPMKGVWQRIADFSLFVWIFAVALVMTKNHPQEN